MGQHWVGVDIGQHCKALLHQQLRRLQGADWVWQQMGARGDHLQFYEVVVGLAGQLGQLPPQPCHPDCLFGRGTAGGVGQHPDPAPVDRLEQTFMAWGLALDPAHRHGDDFAAAGLDALLQAREVGVLAGAGH